MVWDAPIRLMHWSMVFLLGACWWTAENHELEWHKYSAYSMLFIVVLRLYWGFFGSANARFSQFVKSPVTALTYAKTLHKREVPVSIGHNPIGAYSVLLLLALLITQITTGLFSTDVDGFDGGPLADHLDYDLSRAFAEWHELLFNILLAAVLLHVIAIFYYLFWRKQNLIAAMLHGKNKALDEHPTQQYSLVYLLVGIILAALLLCSITVWFAA